MAVQFIVGGSGTGKTTYMVNQMIEKSKKEPGKPILYILPEQANMAAEQDMVQNHPNGGTILKNVKGYASEGTIKSMKEGTIHNLVIGFEKSFNGAFAKEYHEITNVLKDEKVNIGGFELKITYHDENIEIEFPQIGCVYTHMLGHDCHSIVAGEGHANVIIAQLKRYKENGYNLVLSSHYTPETLKDVDTKIAYL